MTAVNILSEDFETPDTIGELGEVIENACTEYDETLPGNPSRRKMKYKINELIDEYNERRGNHIYNHIK